ncbi:hypothetical protein [Micromonospora siamensis]|uniref:Peptidase inhibitor family I36 n=1 Tax=Micromonospora siamensis TaxID=299152 RepID=A0A1C5IV10_9ACTN|nr:hypothetical protein [Micromonospora siamensis]SCG61851.1 hypothetical protein GA0074704_3812 [Micromonospora siamensis]
MSAESSRGTPRRAFRRSARLLALLGGVTMAGMLAVAAPAAAQPTETHAATSHVVAAAVAAPRQQAASGGAQVGAVLAAYSPTISPATNVRYTSNPQTVSCAYGNFCASVWDPTRGTWKVFDLYYCNRYALSYWQGTGYYYNNQYGGVRVYFYNQSGGTLKSFTTVGRGTYNWDPVWYIRNC